MLWQIEKFAMKNKFKFFSFLLCYFITMMTEFAIAAEHMKLETEYAKENEIPYMVSIRAVDNKSIAHGHHICDGVITDEETVVTAAYCLLDKGRSHLLMNHGLIIVAGTVHPTGGGIMRKIKTIFIHPAFNFKTKLNNLAVLTLNNPLPLDNITIKSVNLARTDFPEGTPCIISGWGLTKDKVSDQLQKSTVYIMPKDECAANYAGKNYKVSNNHICAGNGRPKCCYGNSGGPLVCKNVLYGISSFGFGCNLRHFPSVYSNVKEYAKFIETRSDFDAYLASKDENNKCEGKDTQYYGITLFALILLTFCVLCALYCNPYKYD